MNRDDVHYEAMLARDHRFDGKFYVGVKTTGIYCRPICPAKPKRENVEFFTSHIAAEQAGYRPCLRCRPESAPRSPAWIGTSAVVQRAVKVLHNRETLAFNEDEFARSFGVTARHLRRLFVAELGRTPKQIAFENRLGLARKLIYETTLPITGIAFAAGFRSIRRFNAAFLERYHKSPSEIRRQPLAAKQGLRLSLSYRPPFDFDGLLNVYKSHRVGQLERFENGTMHRVVEMGGKVGTVAISNDAPHAKLIVEIDFPDTTAIHAIVSRVRNLFDLDSDPVAIANTLELDAKMKRLLKAHPGIRLPSGWNPFETAIATILGQLVSVERGRTLVADLIALLGRDSGLVIDGNPIRLFPTPEQIAASDLRDLKTTRIRKETLIAFSAAVAKGELSLESTQDVDAFQKKVLAIRGIGPWTAHYMAMKVLRHADAFPASDLILARALEIHSPESVDRMRPWRGYAAALFWRTYAGQLPPAPRSKT